MKLEKYSMGVGDRFGRQGRAQLQAMQVMRAAGVPVVPVWNKSFREHSIIHTQPMDVRRAADAAVAAEKWTGGYHVDADHISLKNVDGFVAASDFFTLDVADHIGVAAPEAVVMGRLRERGLDETEARHRLAAQWPVMDKMERADYVIYNAGTEDLLMEQVARVWRCLRSEAYD